MEWGGTLTDQGNAEAELFQTCVEAAGLETVGVAVACFGTPLGLGPEVCGALQTHGGIHEHFSDARQGIAKAVFEKEVIRSTRAVFWSGLVTVGAWLILTPPFFQPWPDSSNS